MKASQQQTHRMRFSFWLLAVAIVAVVVLGALTQN
jgi:hypothetical protein